MFWFKLIVFVMISVVSQVECNAHKSHDPRKPRIHNNIDNDPGGRRLILHDDQGNVYKFWNISYEQTVSINNNYGGGGGGGPNSTAAFADRSPPNAATTETKRARSTTTQSPRPIILPRTEFDNPVLGDPLRNDLGDESPPNDDERPSSSTTTARVAQHRTKINVAGENQTRPNPTKPPARRTTENRPNLSDQPSTVAESTTPNDELLSPNASGVGSPPPPPPPPPRHSSVYHEKTEIAPPSAITTTSPLAAADAGDEIDPNEPTPLNKTRDDDGLVLLLVENKIKLNFIVNPRRTWEKQQSIERDDGGKCTETDGEDEDMDDGERESDKEPPECDQK